MPASSISPIPNPSTPHVVADRAQRRKTLADLRCDQVLRNSAQAKPPSKTVMASVRSETEASEEWTSLFNWIRVFTDF